MSAEPTVTCPSCNAEIKLTESLAAPLIAATKQQYEKALAQQKADVAKREQTLKEREAQLVQEKEALDASVAEKLKLERAKITVEESKKAKLLLNNDLEEKTKEIEELNQVLEQRNKKLEEAQKAQAELVRKQRELDDAKREMDLTIETRVQESLARTRDQAKKEVEEQQKLKLAEKEKTINDLQTKLEEAIRKAEQGSQQLRGEVQELDLEMMLRTAFPRDTIEEVAKGQNGADVLQRVLGNVGQVCGSILWESKRTIRWNDGWLGKLRQDQRAAKADLAVIMSETMPDGVNHFDQIDGVWIVCPSLAIPLGMALRAGLVDTATARCASEGQQTKMSLLYQYLTSPQFKQRVDAIVDGFRALKSDLDAEKRSTLRRWATREKQLELVMQATSGMYGDLQGIAGKTLPEIEGLQLPEEANVPALIHDEATI